MNLQELIEKLRQVRFDFSHAVLKGASSKELRPMHEEIKCLQLAIEQLENGIPGNGEEIRP